MSGTNKIIVSEYVEKDQKALEKALENANEEAAKIEDKGE